VRNRLRSVDCKIGVEPYFHFVLSRYADHGVSYTKELILFEKIFVAKERRIQDGESIMRLL
jgi:hypothetical protein